ncbi:hypothetical protein L245_25305 [Salmonella enterica subsp. enterica serovar Worthington str. BCH-4719]|nr:hypothetical protein L245_25305 [Salmonella enterica subsp. enterica serovar Worthington str. BCH-4719]
MAEKFTQHTGLVVSLFDAANVGEVAGNGGSGGHRRAD